MKYIIKLTALILSLFYLTLPLSALALNTYSMDFESTSTQMAYAADSASLSITGDISIEVWVKLETASRANYILAKAGDLGDPGWRSYWMYIDADNKLWFIFSSTGAAGSNTSEVSNAAVASAGTWVHLAITADVSAQDIIMYVNGSAVASTLNETGSTAIFDNDKALNIGALYNSGAAAHYFDGLMDEVRIWNDIRTSGEISTNYQTELVGNEAGLAAYWKLNNGALDETTNNNDLTLVNSPVYSTDIPFDTGAATEEYYYVE